MPEMITRVMTFEMFTCFSNVLFLPLRLFCYEKPGFLRQSDDLGQMIWAPQNAALNNGNRRVVGFELRVLERMGSFF